MGVHPVSSGFTPVETLSLPLDGRELLFYIVNNERDAQTAICCGSDRVLST